MKFLILISIYFALATCQNVIPERFRNAKSIREHPQMQKFYQNNVSREGIQPFIVGGSNAILGQIPHHVLIYGIQGLDVYLFGGALIHSRWVLTAAHCLTINYEEIFIMFGIVDTSVMYSSFANGNLSDFILHPNYDADDLSNDIGLIRLTNASSSLLSIPNIGAISLPSLAQVNANLIGLNGTVSGFGKVSDNTTTDLLRYVSLPIVDNSVCANVYEANAVRDTNICTSTTESASTCENDDGGPLSVILNDSTVLVGILSFNAIDGCELGIPVGFTRVDRYLDWILSYASIEETTTTATESTTTTSSEAESSTTTTSSEAESSTTTSEPESTTTSTTTTQQPTTPGTASKIIAVNTILLILLQFLLKA